jgi:hypothetical protein
MRDPVFEAIRLVMVEKNSEGKLAMVLTGIEFFGELVQRTGK